MSLKRKSSLFEQSAYVEQLESRAMLAGHPLAMAAHTATQSQSALVANQVSATVAQVANITNCGLGMTLNSTLTDDTTGASASVNLQAGTTTRLSVNVTGATAGDVLDVTVAGVVVGSITVGDDGTGSLVLSSNPQTGETALPTDFPTGNLKGAVISVGADLTGTLSLGVGTQHGGHHHGTTVTRLSGTLTDTAGTATGSATLKIVTKSDSSTNTRFTVSVTGATASTDLDVSINGTSIGTLTADANGAGSVTFATNPKTGQTALPANFPVGDLTGATVTVGGTISGSLSNNSSLRSGHHR